MPWVRIDENAMEHPKVAALPDGAFRLWVTGLAYCQKFLKDGFISDVAMKGLRGYTAARRDALVTCGLWDAVDGGAQVHDYLEWNESRAHVLNSREQARERLKKHKEKRVANPVANAHPTVRALREENSSLNTRERGVGETIDPVQRLVARHEELHRHFVKVGYIGNPQNDYQAACQIVKAFPEPSMQDAILTYGLNDTDPWMSKGTRTIARIASNASKYAEELKAKKLA
jgi:hypothetical protein